MYYGPIVFLPLGIVLFIIAMLLTFEGRLGETLTRGLWLLTALLWIYDLYIYTQLV